VSKSHPTYIRTEFVLDRIEHRRRTWELRFDLIRTRDEKIRDLNRQYNLMDGDGTYGSSQRHGPPAYLAEYKRINAEFQPQYDGVGPEEDAWDRANDISIHEYLFFDGVTSTGPEFLQGARDRVPTCPTRSN
jgi:hypothetical protein